MREQSCGCEWPCAIALGIAAAVVASIVARPKGWEACVVMVTTEFGGAIAVPAPLPAKPGVRVDRDLWPCHVDEYNAASGAYSYSGETASIWRAERAPSGWVARRSALTPATPPDGWPVSVTVPPGWLVEPAERRVEGATGGLDFVVRRAP
jgi:hypothetical protein